VVVSLISGLGIGMSMNGLLVKKFVDAVGFAIDWMVHFVVVFVARMILSLLIEITIEVLSRRAVCWLLLSVCLRIFLSLLLSK
jgi:hypothetical protein